MVVFYFRNFSNQHLKIHIIGKDLPQVIKGKYLINRSIINISRDTRNFMNDSIYSQSIGKDEVFLDIPPNSTICLKVQANNRIYLFNRFDENNQPIVLLENNVGIIDTLTISKSKLPNPKWKNVGGIFIKNIYFYDYH